MVLVKAELDRVRGFIGKSISTKVGNKKHPVILKLTVDDFSVREAVELAKIDKNIAMINYTGTLSGLSSLDGLDLSDIYIGYEIDATHCADEESVEHYYSACPEFLTPIFRLSDDFCNMKFIQDMCKKFPRVRFTGGKTFELLDCRLGSFGLDCADRAGIQVKKIEYIHDGDYDCFQVLEDTDIDLIVSERKERQKAKVRSSRTANTPKEKKVKEPSTRKSGKKSAFGSFFGDFSGVPL